MRISPVVFGFDATSPTLAGGPPPPAPPASAVERIQAMMAFVYEHTSLRIAGGYNTATGAAWHPVLAGLWLSGWGLSIFDNFDTAGFQQGGSRAAFERFDTASRSFVRVGGSPLPLTFPSAADGEAAARDMVTRAHLHLRGLDRAVVYVDNEDSNPGTRSAEELHDGPVFHELTAAQTRFGLPSTTRMRVTQGGFADMLPFYRGLFRWLEEQPPGVVPFRPGLYVHLPIVGALLAEFPYLHICDNAYFRGPPPALSTIDPESAQVSPPGFLRWHTSRRNAIPQSTNRGRMPAATAGRGPRAEWRAWPAVFQFEGTNTAPLLPGRFTYPHGGKNFDIAFGHWFQDSESSLVDDPAYPAVSPRTSAAGGNAIRLAMVRRDNLFQPPPPGPPSQRERGAQVELAVVGAEPDLPALIERPQANPDPAGALAVEPGIRPVWLITPGKRVLMTARRRRGGRETTLQTHQILKGPMVPCAASILGASDVLDPQSRWTASACDDDNAVVFTVRPDGTLRAAHAEPDAEHWPATEVIGADLVHNYSQLRAASRQDHSIDAFFIGANRCLHTAWWSRDTHRFGHQQIGNDPNALLPSTALAVVSPDPMQLVVLGIGFDLRLSVAQWRSAGGGWSGPTPVGNQDPTDQLLCPHSDLAAVWNDDRKRIEVLALTHDLRICLYELQSTGRWDAPSRRSILFTPVPNPRPAPGQTTIADLAPLAPNPYGDLGLVVADAGRGKTRLASAVFARATNPPGTDLLWTISDAGLAAPAPGKWSASYTPGA